MDWGLGFRVPYDVPLLRWNSPFAPGIAFLRLSPVEGLAGIAADFPRRRRVLALEAPDSTFRFFVPLAVLGAGDFLRSEPDVFRYSPGLSARIGFFLLCQVKVAQLPSFPWLVLAAGGSA